MNRECAALAGRTLHAHTAAVGRGCMLDNGEPQARASQFPASALVHPVEALEDAGQVFVSYAPPLIVNNY